jgi:hypothetical protein
MFAESPPSRHILAYAADGGETVIGLMEETMPRRTRVWNPTLHRYRITIGGRETPEEVYLESAYFPFDAKHSAFDRYEAKYGLGLFGEPLPIVVEELR